MKTSMTKRLTGVVLLVIIFYVVYRQLALHDEDTDSKHEVKKRDGAIALVTDKVCFYQDYTVVQCSTA